MLLEQLDGIAGLVIEDLDVQRVAVPGGLQRIWTRLDWVFLTSRLGRFNLVMNQCEYARRQLGQSFHDYIWSLRMLRDLVHQIDGDTHISEAQLAAKLLRTSRI